MSVHVASSAPLVTRPSPGRAAAEGVDAGEPARGPEGAGLRPEIGSPNGRNRWQCPRRRGCDRNQTATPAIVSRRGELESRRRVDRASGRADRDAAAFRWSCVAAALVGLAWRAVLGVRTGDPRPALARASEADRRGPIRRGAAMAGRGLASRGSPDDAEAAYLLGVCEHAGAARRAAAGGLVARSPPGSPFTARAALARARTLVGDLGRFADAEPILDAAPPGGRRPGGRGPPHALRALLQGGPRSTRCAGCSREGWRPVARPRPELRDLWLIDDDRRCSRRSARSSSQPPASPRRRPRLAGAGRPATPRRPARRGRRDGSTPACDGGPTTRPSGSPGSAGPRPPDDPTRPGGRSTHLPADALREADRLDAPRLARRAARRRRRERRGARAARSRSSPATRRARAAGRARRASRARPTAPRNSAGARPSSTRQGPLSPPPRPMRPRPSGFAELAGLAETLGRPFEA